MTKLHNISDLDLSELYNKRKQKHRAPASIKRAVLIENRHSTSFLPSLNRLTGVAIAASLLLLVSLVVVQQRDWQYGTPTVEYTLVEIHSLDQNPVAVAENVRQKNAQHYANYLLQEQILARHHRKSAVLNVASQGWELATCEQELVKISAELVASLQQLDRVGTQFKTGDFVSIDFDKNGLIVGIYPAASLPHC